MDTIAIKTTLSGYIRIDKPGGKFDNCCFSFTIPPKALAQLDEAYDEAIEWAAGKIGGRMEKALPKWEEDGSVKYSYGSEESSGEFFAFVDGDGEPYDEATTSRVREGTTAILLLGYKPYVFGKKGGLSLKVLGGRLLDIVEGEGGGAGAPSEDEVTNALLAFEEDEPEEKPKRSRMSAAKAPAKATRSRSRKAATDDEDGELPF